MNKVILVGRLGQDPILSFAKNRMPICRFSVATSESYKDSKGERIQKTEWHKIVVFGMFAETCQINLEQGREVSIEGKLETTSFTDKEGIKRSSTNIVASRVEFLGSFKNKTPKDKTKAQMDFDMETGEVFGTSFAPDDIPF